MFFLLKFNTDIIDVSKCLLERFVLNFELIDCPVFLHLGFETYYSYSNYTESWTKALFLAKNRVKELHISVRND